MRISLSSEQEAWLRDRFAITDPAALEQAARQILDERIAEWDSDDLEWAKPLVDEGVAALDRGASISLAEHRARNAARLAALKK